MIKRASGPIGLRTSGIVTSYDRQQAKLTGDSPVHSVAPSFGFLDLGLPFADLVSLYFSIEGVKMSQSLPPGLMPLSFPLKRR